MFYFESSPKTRIIPLQKEKKVSFATIADVIAPKIGSEIISFDDATTLSQEQSLEVHHAVHILKIHQKKDRFWKKVFGKKTDNLFYYNCLTEEKQFMEPIGYIDVMDEPAVWNKNWK